MLLCILSICILEEKKRKIKNIQGDNMSNCMMGSHGSKGYFTYCNDSPVLDRNIFSSSQVLDNQTKYDKRYSSLIANPPQRPSSFSNPDNFKRINARHYQMLLFVSSPYITNTFTLIFKYLFFCFSKINK